MALPVKQSESTPTAAPLILQRVSPLMIGVGALFCGLARLKRKLGEKARAWESRWFSFMSRPAERLQQFFKEIEGEQNKALEKASGSRDRTTVSYGHSSKQREAAVSNSRHEINADKAPFDQVRYWD